MATRKRETLEELAAESEPAMTDVPGEEIEPMPGEPKTKRSLLVRIAGAFAWGAHHGGTTDF